MSTELKTTTDAFTLTRFYGGEQRGVCVQVTQPNPNYDSDAGGPMFNYVQLTRDEARQLAKDLMDFAAGAEEECYE
jgi:hypothetical protein